eukprot:scaffold1916_cov123-Isochrysis_galbana.AAC.4
MAAPSAASACVPGAHIMRGRSPALGWAGQHRVGRGAVNRFHYHWMCITPSTHSAQDSSCLPH